MDRLARLATLHPRRVLAVTAAFAVAAAVLGLGVPSRLGRASNDFLPGDAQSVRAENAVEAASGLSAAPQLLVLVQRPTRARLGRVAALVRTEPVFPVLAAPLFSRDRSEAVVSAYARGGISQQRWRKAAERVDRRLQTVPGTAVGGPAIAVVQVNHQVQRDLTRAEALAFPALFLIALFVFRSVVAAVLPLVVGGLTILAALLLLRILDAITPVSPYALNIVTGAGLGLAIDYSLLLVSRYREEMGSPNAIRTTLRTAGRTIAFSSVTVGAAVATLAVFPLGFLRSMGIAGGLVGPLAGLIALTVLPALFMLLGSRVNTGALPRWRRAAERAAAGEQGGW